MKRSVRTALSALGLAAFLGLGLVPSDGWGGALQAGAGPEAVDSYLDRLVTEMRASLPNLHAYEPLVVLTVVNDAMRYRVRSSDLLERRLAEAFARQAVRIIDETARLAVLERLEACYTVEARLCRVEDVVAEYRPAAGWVEGYLLGMSDGVELRLRLLAAASLDDATPGEIVGSWSVVIPPSILDPVEDLRPVAGVRSFGVAAANEDPAGGRVAGELRIVAQTQDGAAAWVYVDGRGYGSAPVSAAVTPGRHLVTVAARGHQPYNEEIEIEPARILTRRITLQLGVGTLVVTSEVNGAQVYVDDELIGSTPWAQEKIESGTHRIRVEKPGYNPFLQEVSLEHGDVARIRVELHERPGGILVTCLRDSVRVFLDMQPVGICNTAQPLAIENVPAGWHQVIGRNGDQMGRQGVQVVGDQIVPLELRLVRR